MERAASCIAFLLARAAAPLAAAPAEFNLLDYGAKGDTSVNEAGAFQPAVDACAAAGGGTVRVPPGDYLSGTIRLASRVTLRLEKGATIYASTDRADYREGHRHLLEADGAEGVAVEGEGTLHGQATADYGERWGAPEKPAFRTGILLFQGCRSVALRGFRVLFSDAWTLHLKRCEGVVIEDVTIANNTRRLNSDGIDPNSCRNVRIRRCRITAGDDAIVLKSTEPFPCEDVEVSDCVLESPTAAFKLGTESRGDFRDVVIRDCTIRNSPVGVGLYLKDGAVMERITAANLRMAICDPSFHDVAPLFIDIERRHPDSKAGRVRDVTFRDIEIAAGTGLLLQGMPESPIENLTLARVTLRVEKADDYAKRKKPVGGRRTTRDARDTCYARLPAYAAVAHVRGLTIDGFQVRIGAEAAKAFARSALAVRHVEGGTIRGVLREPAPEPGALPAVDLQECRDLNMD